jgi:hypothetical protein
MLKRGVILAGKPPSATERRRDSILKDEGGRIKVEDPPTAE